MPYLCGRATRCMLMMMMKMQVRGLIRFKGTMCRNFSLLAVKMYFAFKVLSSASPPLHLW